MRIKLVVSVGMGAGSEIGAEQKGQDFRRFSKMGYPVRDGDGHSPLPAQEAEDMSLGTCVHLPCSAVEASADMLHLQHIRERELRSQRVLLYRCRN